MGMWRLSRASGFAAKRGFSSRSCENPPAEQPQRIPQRLVEIGKPPLHGLGKLRIGGRRRFLAATALLRGGAPLLLDDADGAPPPDSRNSRSAARAPGRPRRRIAARSPDRSARQASPPCRRAARLCAPGTTLAGIGVAYDVGPPCDELGAGQSALAHQRIDRRRDQLGDRLGPRPGRVRHGRRRAKTLAGGGVAG